MRESERSAVLTADQLLIEQIRSGDNDAWAELINKFEGRLHAFVARRLNHHASVEDLVQETFLGFLISLPNFDASRSIEGYLFSICSYKIADLLRKSGKGFALSLDVEQTSSQPGVAEPPSSDRMLSSVYRSKERRDMEELRIIDMLSEDIARWRSAGEWLKLSCLELIFVRAFPNREIAQKLQITEQKVANFKSDYLIRLKKKLSDVE